MICLNDRLAVGAYQALDDFGREAFEVLLREINRDRAETAPPGETHRLPMPVRMHDSVAAPGA